MTVAIDGIVFSLQHHGGISVYFRELLNELARENQPARLTLETPALQDVVSPGASVTIACNAARSLERFRRARVPAEATVFHSSYYRLPAAKATPTVVTVHDFTYELFRTGPRRWAHVAAKHAAIRAAQSVICISEATRQDLLRFVGETPGQEIHVVHNGVSDTFHPIELAPAARPYMLFIGERAGYKNFALALQALALLPDMELHCVGGGLLRQDELTQVPDGVRARVRHLGYVSDETLNEHYNRAACLVYPSRYEGFGIPVIEAMRAGCPVVCIDCKAVIEVGGEALTIAADEARSLADAVSRTQDADYRRAITVAGVHAAANYSWRATHRRTLQIYRGLGAQPAGTT
jgi:mannosyltransferase